MNNSKKVLLILSFIILVLSAFGYGYYNTLRKMLKDTPNPKPQPAVKVEYADKTSSEHREVTQILAEDKVTPSTLLYERIISLNTGMDTLKQIELPNDIINFTEKETAEYFKEYNSIEFSKDKIILEKKMPNLPNHFIVKLENKYIKVFITNDKGEATIFDDFKPIPYKNKDEQLEKGIEVERLEDIWVIIQDYD